MLCIVRGFSHPALFQLEHVIAKMDKLCIARADDLLHQFEDVLTYRGNDYVQLIGMAYVGGVSHSPMLRRTHTANCTRTQEAIPYVGNKALARFGTPLLKPVDVNLMA